MANHSDVIFRVTEPDRRVEFPDFAKPLQIGHFSRNGDDQPKWDKSRLASYCPPDSIGALKLDLNDGYGQQIEQRQRMHGCLDYLLRWIVQNSRQSPSNQGMTALQNAICGADIVCWRGLLTKLASTPYEQREGWMVGAVRFGNVIFLVEFDTDDTKRRYEQMGEREKRMTYWGHRFELYVTKSADQTAANATNRAVVDCNEQFCGIFRTKLSPPRSDSFSRSLRLVYGAEIDCVDDAGEYIELKTSRVIEGARQDRNFKRFKLLKWWLQSFLVGIDRIVCGHRDDAGIVKYLKPYNVSDMPKMAAEGSAANPLWSGASCMNFLYQLAVFIETNTPPAIENCLSEIVVFEYDAGSRMVRLVKGHEYTSDQVLPDWFVNAFGKV